MKYKNFPIFLFIVAVGIGVLFFWVFRNYSITPKSTDKVTSTPSEDRVFTPPVENKNAYNGKTLDLSNKNLEKLPLYVTDRSDLEVLIISNNKLTGALPSEIGKLKNLKVLNASNNLMTGVPAEIGHLPNLEILDLSNNKLTGLPNELGELKKLKVLNLSGNDYSKQDLEVIKKGLPSNVEIIL